MSENTDVTQALYRVLSIAEREQLRMDRTEDWPEPEQWGQYVLARKIISEARMCGIENSYALLGYK